MEIEQYFPFFNLDDINFNDVISNVDHNYPLSVINTMVYNPNHANFRDHAVDHMSEPILTEPVCEYIFSGEDLINELPSSSLNIFSYNISSVPQHLESFFEQCLTPYNVEFDFLGLCETRLNYRYVIYIILITVMYRFSKTNPHEVEVWLFTIIIDFKV